MIRVAVDAMGGDNAPVEMVAGAVEAVKKKPGSFGRTGKDRTGRTFQIYL